jgi:hypothetical protein
MRLSVMLFLFFAILSSSSMSYASPGTLDGPPVPEAGEHGTENGSKHASHRMSDVSLTQRSRAAGRISKIVGWSVFGSAYVGAAILGAMLIANGISQAWPLFIPVAGPAVLAGEFFASDVGNDGTESDGWGDLLGTFFLIPTIVQTAGAVLLTVGYVKAYRDRRVSRLNRFSVALLPMQKGDGARLGFGMRF